MATITGIKAGTTTITATYTDGGVTKSSSVTFTVTALTPTLTFTANSTTLYYTGSNQNIGTILYSGDGTVYYKVVKATSQPSVPTDGWTSVAINSSNWTSVSGGKQLTIQSSSNTGDAGTYYVFLKSDAGTGYAAVAGKSAGNKAINKRTVTCTAPTVKTDTIQYTGNNQALLSGNGSASPGGVMYYYVSTSATTPTVTSGSAPGTGWNTTAPSKKDVGTYYIWYYVYIADTDNNAAGTNVSTVKSLGSKEIEQRTGAAPTFSASSVTAKCTQGSNATTSPAVNAGAFTAASAGHTGSITSSILHVVK